MTLSWSCLLFVPACVGANLSVGRVCVPCSAVGDRKFPVAPDAIMCVVLDSALVSHERFNVHLSIDRPFQTAKRIVELNC